MDNNMEFLREVNTDPSLQWALAHITSKAIFAIECNGKRPATAHGFKDATADENAIRAMAAANPGCNWAFVPGAHDLVVIDVDPRNGGTRDGWPETYTVRTPSGGWHLYYYLEGGLPSGTNKFGPGIDVKSNGGYVLLPGSCIDGVYYTPEDELREYAPFPDDRLAALTAKSVTREAPADVELDDLGNVARAVTALQADRERNGEPREGQSSDARAFAMAAMCRDLGVSEDRTTELLHETWASHFDWEWLTIKVANAFRYAQNTTAGVDAVGSAAKAFAPYIEKMKLEAASAAVDAEPEDEAEAADESWSDLVARFMGSPPDEDAMLPDIEFFDAFNFYPRTLDGSVVLMYGPYGGGKSTLAVSDLIAMIKAHIENPKKVKPVYVAYGIGEGRHGMRKLRVPAIAEKFGIDLKVLREFWRTIDLPDLTNKRHVKAYIAALSRVFGGQLPDICVIDTLHSSSGTIDENSDAIGKLLGNGGPVGLIKRKLGGPLVLVVDHTGKDASKGARGHSSKGGDVDTLIEVTEFDRKAGRAAKWLEKQKDGEDKFTVDYSLTTTGVPVATAIGRVDGKKGAPRKLGTSWREKILCVLEWFSEWGEGKECKVTVADVVTALMRSRMWTEPEAPGAAAPDVILAKPRTPEEEAAARAVQHAVNREALRWSKRKDEYRGIVAKSETSAEWMFKAHAAARLKSSASDEGEKGDE
jgi:hypothetical protein